MIQSINAQKGAQNIFSCGEKVDIKNDGKKYGANF